MLSWTPWPPVHEDVPCPGLSFPPQLNLMVHSCSCLPRCVRCAPRF